MLHQLTSFLLLSCVQALPLDGFSLSSIKTSLSGLVAPEEDPLESEGLPAIFGKNPELFKFHRDVVSVSSVSYNEKEISEFMKECLESLGLTVKYLPTADGRNNVWAYLGDTPSTKVLLTSHIDTVPPFFDYSVKEESGEVRIYGRGTDDAKASVATQVTAFKELLKDGKIKEGDVSLLYVVGEEVGGDGMKAADKQLIAKGVNWDTVIFGEPTDNTLSIGHKGLYMGNVKVYGHACHSAYPWLGVDANKIAIEIMHELENAPFPGSKALGNDTINIGLIQSHNAANVVSSYFEFTAIVRIGSSLEEVSTIFEGIVHKHEKDAVKIVLTAPTAAGPTYTFHDIPGFNLSQLNFGTDIPHLTDRGFRPILYGAGSIANAHGAEEYVTPETLLTGVTDVKRLVKFALEN